MATTNFNIIVLNLARLLKTPRLLATDDVQPYTSAYLTQKVNEAVRDFLKEKFLEYGPERFETMFPEYVKESGALTNNGMVIKPVDAFLVLGVRNAGLPSVSFYPVPPNDIEDVKAGTNRMIVPSATKPVFWEENGVIVTAGIASGSAYVRYISTPTDIVPITTAVGSGFWSTAAGAYTAATRTLTATMSRAFVNGDVNKLIAFGTATATYGGRIESRTDDSTVVLAGENLPTGNILAASVLNVIVLETDPDAADLKLKKYWHGEILSRAYQQALTDARLNVMPVKQ